MWLLLAHYFIPEGEKYRPKKVMTYYFSPLCHNCFELKEQTKCDDDTLIIFQPVLMDDHDLSLQIFILSLIKKFHFSDFWHYAKKFQTVEREHLTSEETALKMGFNNAEIQWIKAHKNYQKAIEKELRHPVHGEMQKDKVIYKIMADTDIAYVPMLK